MKAEPSIELGALKDEKGREWTVTLEINAIYQSPVRSSSKVGDMWVRNPAPPPVMEPRVTLVGDGGFTSHQYPAVRFFEAAIRGRGWLIPSAWADGDDDVSFSPAEIARMSAHICATVPHQCGSFGVQWNPAPPIDDGLPF